MPQPDALMTLAHSLWFSTTRFEILLTLPKLLNYMPYTLSKDNLTVTITLHHNTIRKITLSKASKGVEKTKNTIGLLDDISAYLDYERVDFSRYSVDLKNLTDFQQMVLNEVRQIPYGVTVTYGMLAKDLQTSPRAIGGALSKNPAPIVIPCHRVIGKHGLGGFAWGVTIKKHLLHVEGASIDSQSVVPSTRLEYWKTSCYP